MAIFSFSKEIPFRHRASAPGHAACGGRAPTVCSRCFSSASSRYSTKSGTLKLVGLTVTDVVQMLEDSGITLQDLMEVVSYVTSTPATPAAAPPTAAASADSDAVTSDDAKAAVFLLKQYEQTLADWLMTAGYDALHPAYPLPAQ